MKLEPFNHATKQWDRFKEFYNEVDIITSRYYYHAPFIHLETGEFIVTQGYYKPKYRRFYEDQNITITNSDDWNFKTLLRDHKLTTPDGDEVKPSWLNNTGAQYLWIDHDTMRVVDMGISSKETQAIPKRLRTTAYVYYAAPNEAPISNSYINVVEVDKLNPDEKDHINSIRAACKVWNELSDEAKVDYGSIVHQLNIYNAATRGYTANPYYYSRQPMHITDLLKTTFNDMDWQARKRVATLGVVSRKKTTEFAYLNLTKR